jgi:ABC-2 type transport system permease protein
LAITHTDDLESALQKVRDGDYAAAAEQSGNEVVVHYSAADPVQAGTVQGLLSSAVQQANISATGQPPRYSLRTQQVEDESLKTIQYVTPGLLGWAVATSATFGAALTLVTWRSKFILRRLRLAPITSGSVVGARIIVSLGISLAQTAIFLGVATLPYFGLHLDHFWWMAIPLVAAATLAFLAIGLLIGARAKTVESASGLAQIIVLPMAFLSGSFFPLDDAPGWLKVISSVLPLKYLVESMQDVMVRGQGPASALPALAALLAFALVLTLIAVRTFRWEDS